MRFDRRIIALATLLLLPAPPGSAVTSDLVLASAKITRVTIPGIQSGSQFGYEVAELGDVNGDGFDDLAVGARHDDSGGTDAGAVWILFLDATGSVLLSREISEGNDPNNAFQLEPGTFFGDGLAGLGDYDGDGRYELAVGATFADPPGTSAPSDSGAVYVVDLDPATAAPLSSFRVYSGSPLPGGGSFSALDASDRFGRVANVGDWDADGAPELAVGAFRDDDGGVTDNGAFYVLYLRPDGTGVKTWTKFSATAGGFDQPLDANESFLGISIEALGDFDGDGQTELAVGATAEGPEGAVFVLFPSPICAAGPAPAVPFTDCVLKPGKSVRIAEGSGGLSEPIQDGSGLGESLAWLDDPSSLIPPRLAVGAKAGDAARGGVWLLTLATDGHVAGADRIASGVNWSTTLDAGDELGSGVAPIGDLDDNGTIDLAVGAWLDDDGGASSGALHLLALSPCNVVITHPIVYASPDDSGVNACLPLQLPSGAQTLHLYLGTGDEASSLPGNVCQQDLGDGDELCAWDVRVVLEGGAAIVAPGFSPTPPGGAPPPGGSVTGPPSGLDWQVVSPTELRVNWIDPGTPSNPAAGPIKIGDLAVDLGPTGEGRIRLGANSVAIAADLGQMTMAARPLAVPEPRASLALLVGVALLVALARQRARRAAAAALVLALAASAPPAGAATSVKGQKSYVQPSGSPTAFWGVSLARMGDLDGDGTEDVLVGDIDEASCGGRFWELFLDEREGLAGHMSIVNSASCGIARSVAALGDIDGDGGPDFAHGINGSSTGHRVELLSLRPNGTVKSQTLLVDDTSTLAVQDLFGWSVASLGDIDGDGNFEIAVGEPNVSSGRGTVWIYSVNPLTRSVVTSSLINQDDGIGLSVSDYFGASVTSLGDLDGDLVTDIAVGAALDDDRHGSCGHGGSDRPGSVYVLFLQVNGPGNFSVKSVQKISETQGGLDLCLPAPTGGASVTTRSGFGFSLAWAPHFEGGGTLYVGARNDALLGENASIWPVFLNPDGTVRARYRLSHDANVGFVNSKLGIPSEFGNAILAVPDMNGDEVPDLLVADMESGPEKVYLLYMQDSDHDGLDDNLDNCIDVHNPLQEDADDDGVGDLCDNCKDVPNPNQADLDLDGEGDLCEPVEIVLQTTGTPAAPSWDLSLQCGAYSVTHLNGAIVLPSGATNPKLLSLAGASVGGSSVSGPGLVAPPGVRGDAIYFQAAGNGAPDNRLCTALQPPVSLGTLTTGPIAGTQLAAAALSAEGVGTPGFGFALAATAGAVPVPSTNLRLVNGLPLPILDLELGPAVQTQSGTRWEVCIPRASEEFHRVAFGLIAPAGTTTGQMRWAGCNSAPNGSGQRTCTAGPGFGPGVNAAQSWTVGPSASPSGTLLPHTLYVVLEGGRFSSGLLPTLNFPGQGVCLGAVELDSSPDLEPALTTDGVNDVDDFFGPGKVVPFEQVLFGAADPTQVKLIGQFNPAADVDDDGIQDLGDNCPFAANPAQTNRGSFLDPTDESDILGDACQCAEASDDGAVLDPDDFDEIRDYLAGRITNPVIAAEIESRCSVAGTTECNIRDLVFLRKALDAAAPSVDVRCDAALSPAEGP